MRAKQGDEHWQSVLQRYSTLIAAKRQKVRNDKLLLDELVSRHLKLLHRYCS